MQSLIEDVVDMQKLGQLKDNQEGFLDKSEFSLNQLLTKVRETYEIQCQGKKIDLLVDPDFGTRVQDLIVTGD